MRRLSVAACFAALMALPAIAPAAATAAAGAAAFRAPQAVRAPMMAVARAGERLVAAGDYGTVLLSDDAGRTWRQAATVPTRETLTALSFIDARHGWAVGHGGLVLATRDAGNTWESLHSAGKEVALFAVHFTDAAQGLAVGAFGFAMETRDGGRSWRKFAVAQGELADRHLYSIFAGADGSVWIAAEAGTVFRSPDGGRSFVALALPYKGSLWGGAVLSDKSILVWGMRGHVLHSADQGRVWREVPSGTDQAFTAGLQRPGGEVVLVGLGGVVARSRDGGRNFSTHVRPQRQSHTAVIEAGGTIHTFTLAGVGGGIGD